MRLRCVLLLFALVLLAAPAAAQNVVIRATDPSTLVTTNVGDSTNTAIRVRQAGAAWTFNWTLLLGAPPSQSNPMPARLTDGVGFVDGTFSGAINVGVVGGTVSALGHDYNLGSDLIIPVNQADSTVPISIPGNTALNPLFIECTSLTCGATFTDGDTFSVGNSDFMPNGGVFNDSLVDLASTHIGEARITKQRAFHVNLRDSLGNEIITTTTTPGGTDRGIVVRNIPSGTQTISGAVTGSGNFTVVQPTGTNLHAVIDTGSTTAVTGNVTTVQATAANLNAQVQGAGASGAAKAGNPVQIGGVFNTTQPTVTTGQGVEAQLTARGAQIVATGVDAFTVAGTVTTTPPANASTNVAQLAGTTTDTNSGSKSAGTLRVVLATDQPALTNKLLVTPDSVALPANQSVNVAQIAGTATVTGGVAGILAVGGNVANAVAATANPVPVGGVFTTSPATLTTGQTATAQFTAAQNLKQDLTTIAGTAPTTAGKIDVKGADGDVFVRQATGTNLHAVLDTTSTTAVTQATAANLNATVTQLALTKGTQGATGVSTQDLKDAGRTALSFYANNVASGTTTTETIFTLTKASGTAATTTGTSFVVTNGKRFRITSITFGSRGNTTAVAQISTFSLRVNTAGACIVTSTPIELAGATATPATSFAWDRLSLPIPDGYEILGDGTLTFCVTANAVFVTSAPTWFVNIVGFEY